MEDDIKKPDAFWNAEYCKMCFTHFFITLAVFMRFPMFRAWAGENGETPGSTYFCGALFCIGMFVLGPFNAYLVDAFRRKQVCLCAIAGMVLAGLGMAEAGELWQLAAIRLFEGMCFGVFEMSLGGTLINDLSCSQRRTQTDYHFLWFGRLSLPLGLIAGWWLLRDHSADYLLHVSSCVAVAGMLPFMSLKVPFRAPNRVPLLSLDRFWQPQAWVLVLNLLPVAIVEGLLLGSLIPPSYMGMAALGLLAAYIVHRNFFESADERADAVAGLLLMMASMALLMMQHETRILYVAFFMLGAGIGWTVSRFLLYFLKLSNHCQRGTLQQTYVLASCSGMCIGFFLAGTKAGTTLLALILSATALAFYLLVTHRWFKKQGGRDFKFREV